MSRPSANGEAVGEVLTTVHRRRWTVAENIQLVQESLQPGMNVSYVARKIDLSPSQLFHRRKLMSDGGKTAVQADDQIVGAGEGAGDSSFQAAPATGPLRAEEPPLRRAVEACMDDGEGE